MKKTSISFIIICVIAVFFFNKPVIGQVLNEKTEPIGFEQEGGYVFDAGPDRLLGLAYCETGVYSEPRTMLFETNFPGNFVLSAGEVSGIGLPDPKIFHSLFFIDLVYNLGIPMPPTIFNNPLIITGMEQDWIGITAMDPASININSEDIIEIAAPGLQAGLYVWTVLFNIWQM